MALLNWRKELPLFGAVLGLILILGVGNAAFFSLDNLADLLRNSIVIGIMALGVMVVMASGGIDVSFTAIAIFSAYATTRLLLETGSGESIVLAFVSAAFLGSILGLINALFIAWLRLPTLIVTLGTLSLFRGAMLTFLGSEYITALPNSMVAFSRWDLVTGLTSGGSMYRVPVAFLALPLTAVLVSLLLNRTYWGRGIYAIGGDRESAERAGFATAGLQTFIYCFVGALSALAGMIHVTLGRIANPFDLVGMELNVIAAVVLGGARLTGGYGSVTGTLLGVALIVMINNSLILLGVPSFWQRVVVGLMILIGAGTTVVRGRALRGVRT